MNTEIAKLHFVRFFFTATEMDRKTYRLFPFPFVNFVLFYHIVKYRVTCQNYIENMRLLIKCDLNNINILIVRNGYFVNRKTNAKIAELVKTRSVLKTSNNIQFRLNEYSRYIVFYRLCSIFSIFFATWFILLLLKIAWFNFLSCYL